MSGSLKLGIILIVAVVVIGLTLRLAGALLSVITPLVILAGIGLIVYGLINRKALGGGRRYLP